MGDSDGDSKGAFVSSNSNVETQEEDRGLDQQAGHSLSDTSVTGNKAKELGREQASSLEMRGGSSAENTRSASSMTPSPLPHIQPEPAANGKDRGNAPPSPPPPLPTSVHQHLSSPRISESSLSGPLSSSQFTEPSTGLSQDNYDEVILQNPVPTSPPPLISDTDIVEDFPLPPPPYELEQEAGQQTVERFVYY